MAEDDDDHGSAPGEPDNPDLKARSVGKRLANLANTGANLGATLARRVGALVADAAGRTVVTDALREPLFRARQLRLGGEAEASLTQLRELVPRHPNDPFLRLSIAYCHIHDLIGGGRPIRPLQDVAAALGDALGRGPQRVLEGALRLYEAGGRADKALDELRRAAPELDKLPTADEPETRFLVHLLSGLAHLRLGNEERALRELQKARARMPMGTGAPLRGRVSRLGVELSLAAGELGDAEAWVRESLAQNANDRHSLELLIRTLAAKGDRVGAHALLEGLGFDVLDETLLWVGLTVGLPDECKENLQAVALRWLQADTGNPEHRRIWALAELRRLRHDTQTALEDADEAVRHEIIAALVAAAEAAPPVTRDRFLQEVAHTALRLDLLGDPAKAPILHRLERDEGTAPEELRLVRARLLLREHDTSTVDFVDGEPPRFRPDPDVGGPWGPDPRSPVRDPDLRGAVLASHRALAAAELCLERDDPDLAQDLLVEALVEWPGLRRAAILLGSLGRTEPDARLEDLLASATTLLAAVPNRVLGVSLEGVQRALSLVVAARERLVRPLTIAIMGEFSAGKSTFVNALLGEAVAPMGVLPTTTTINVFRRGTAGGARIHYRDGRISMVAPDEVQTFLHGLDDTEASRIRHVEIERTGARMGDAAVVDTPGLNALDAYHEQVAREYLDEADAVIWVFSATRSGAASEVGMLSELRQSGRQVLGVLNKVDTLDASEQTELTAYLQEQLGEVLVDVVPLRARDALEFRTQDGSTDAQASDLFAPVETALETHFLQRARELKRSLTARRLGEALGSARESVIDAIAALEQRAKDAKERLHGERSGIEAQLARFAERVDAGVLAVDDVLVRESLGLGVLETGEGMHKGPLDTHDAHYLAACVRDTALAGLQRALLEVAREDPTTSEVLDRTYVPWARGHLEGLLGRGFVDEVLTEHGPKIAGGEAAARVGFREALGPTATMWAEHARGLVHAVARERRRFDRHAASAPQAEATRLRTAVLTSIDALRHASIEASE